VEREDEICPSSSGESAGTRGEFEAAGSTSREVWKESFRTISSAPVGEFSTSIVISVGRSSWWRAVRRVERN